MLCAAACAALALPAAADALEPVSNPTAVAGNGQVTLSWTNPADPEFTDARIYRRTDPTAAWTLVHTEPETDPTPETWTDTGLSNLTRYYYAIRSYDSVALQEVDLPEPGGLWGYYYDGQAFNTYKGRQLDTTVNFNWGGGKPALAAANDSYSMKWDGKVYIDYAETYTFYLNKDDGGRLYVDGTPVVNNWGCGCGEFSGTIALTPGWHDLDIEYYENNSNAWFIASWSSPSVPKAVIPSSKLATEQELSAIPSDVALTVTAPDGGEVIETGSTNITWNKAGSDPVFEYRLSYSTDGGVTYPNAIATVNGAQTSHTWVVPENTNANTYRIRVAALTAQGYELASDTSNGNFEIDTQPPAAITNLEATAGNGMATLTWTNPADPDFDHVEIYRSTQEGSVGSLVHVTLDDTVTSWVDSPLTNGTHYYYTVRSVDVNGATGITVASTGGLTASHWAGNPEYTTWVYANDPFGAAINRDWGGGAMSSPNYPGYMVYDWFSTRYHGVFFAEFNQTYTFYADKDDGARIWIDGNLVLDNWTCGCGEFASSGVPLTRGWHTIRLDHRETTSNARIRLSWSAASVPKNYIPASHLGREPHVDVQPTAATLTLDAPVGGESLLGDKTLPIAWTTVGGGGSVVLSYSTDGGATFPYVIEHSLPTTGSLDWAIPGGINSSQFRVRAELRQSSNRVSAVDESANLTIDTVTVGPPAVTDVQTVPGNNQVLVTWTNPAVLGTFDHVEIYRSTVEGDPGVLVHTTANSGITSWLDTGTTNGNKYWYRVRAADAAGRSSRAIVPGQVQRSVYTGADHQTWRWTDSWTSVIHQDHGGNGLSSIMGPGEYYYDNMSMRYVGLIYIDTAGTYLFDSNGSFDGARLWIDNVQLYNQWLGCNCSTGDTAGHVYLTAGWHDFRAEYRDTGDNIFRTYLAYSGPGVAYQAIPMAKHGYERTADATPGTASVTLDSPNSGTVLGNGVLDVQWSGANASSSRLSYSLDSGASWKALTIDEPISGTRQWVVPDGINTTQLRLKVDLYSATGQWLASDRSDSDITVDTQTPGPPPIEGLSVLPGNGQVTVSWVNPTPLGSFTRVQIYRSAVEGEIGSLVHTTASSATTSWNDLTVVNGVKYWYRVRSVDGAGRVSRAIVPGQILRSVYTGADYQNFRWEDPYGSPLHQDHGGNGVSSAVAPGEYYYDNFSLRYRGMVFIDTAGYYWLDSNGSFDGARVSIDGLPLYSQWNGCNCSTTATVGQRYLEAGWHEYVADYHDDGDNIFRTYLSYGGPGVAQQAIPMGKSGYERIAHATPSTASVTIDGPNTGTYLGNHVVPISWTGANASTSRLSYSVDSGATWRSLTIDEPISGTANWSVPDGINTTQLRFKVDLYSGTGQWLASDISDNDITVDTVGAPPPGVDSVSAVPANGQVTVSWTNPNPLGTFDHVNIYRSDVEGRVGTLVHSTANSGVTSWVDGAVSNNTKYWYTVRSVDAVGRVGRSIVTNLLLRSVYTGADYQNFRWEDPYGSPLHQDHGGNGVSSAIAPGEYYYDNFSMRYRGMVFIDTAGYYWLDGNGSFDGMRLWVDGLPLFNQWNTCNCSTTATVGNRYLEAGWHEYVAEYHDDGDNIFRTYLSYGGPGVAQQAIPINKSGYERVANATPTLANVTIDAPNAGTYRGNQVMRIAWTGANASSSRLSYSLDSGVTWKALSIDQPISGTADWSIPENINTTQMRLKVDLYSGTGQWLTSDVSDADMTVDTQTAPPPPVSNVRATAGNGQITVTWDNPAVLGTFDHVEIYRSSVEGQVGELVHTTASSATTSWVDTTVSNGIKYWYRVRAADNTGRLRRAIVPNLVLQSAYTAGDFQYFRWERPHGAFHGDYGGGGIAHYEYPGGHWYDNFSVRYNGMLYIDTAGYYWLDGNGSFDGMRLWVDGIPLFDQWNYCNCSTSATVGQRYLEAGWHEYVAEYHDDGDNIWRTYLSYGGPGVAQQGLPMSKSGYEERASAVAHAAIVDLTTPAGGETLGGTTTNIEYTTVGAPAGSAVKLSYSTDGGQTYPNVLTRSAGGSPWEWYLPRELNAASVRVKAEIIESGTGFVIAADETPAFSIDTASLDPVNGLAIQPGWTSNTLTWTNPAGGSFDRVNIYRSTDQWTLGPLLTTVMAPATTYEDTGLTNGNTYYYTVRAADAQGREALSMDTGRFRADNYQGADFNTFVGTTLQTSALNYNWETGVVGSTGVSDWASIRYTGYVYIDSTGGSWVGVSDTWDGARLTIGGTNAINTWCGGNCQINDSAPLGYFRQGWYPFEYEYHDTTSTARARFYIDTPASASTIVPIGNFALEVRRAGTPMDTTPPTPNPHGSATAVSPTQIDWSLSGASDAGAGLHATPYSFDNGVGWQASDTYSRTALSPNTQYSQTLIVRDAANNQTTPRSVAMRTLALAPNVVADQPDSTWLGPNSVTVTFTNNAAWGPGGVQYYRYVWDTSPSHTWNNTETVWNASTLQLTPGASGQYYLHLKSYNGDNVGGGTVDLGPFNIDISPPTPNPPIVGTAATQDSVTFTVTGATDAESGLAASAYSFDGGTTWQASNQLQVTGLNPNDSISRNVVVRDVTGNVTSVRAATGVTLAEDPDVTSAPVPDATWRPSGTVVNLSSNVAFGPGSLWGYRYKVSTNPTDTVAGTDPAWTSGVQPVTITGTSDSFYIHVRSYNSDNVGGATQSIGPFKVDGAGPGATTPIADADPTNVAPEFSWTPVTDAESGLVGYKVYRSTSSGALGVPLSTQPGTTFTDNDPLLDGQRYWYTVQAYDNLGNEQTVGNVQIGITYDSITPIGNTVSIEAGAAYVGSQNVTLTLNSTNASEMKIGNLPDLSDGVWEPFSATRGWNLTAGDGSKHVYVRYRSANNTESATVSDQAILDTTAPTPDPASASATVVSATAITWVGSGSLADAGAGLHASPYSFDNGGSWRATDLAENALAPNTEYTKTVRYRDALGNATASGTVSATTLPAAPDVSSVPAEDAVNTQPLGTTFTFTNVAGFGAGAVEYYRWEWSTSPTHTFLGTEAVWNAATTTHQEWNTGTYYAHFKAYNSADAGGQELTLGPFMLAPPTGSQTVNSNVAETQTLSCDKTDFTVSLLPGTSDDALVDCDVTSAVAGWNLKVHAGGTPFFTGFVDDDSTIAAYTGPAAGDGHVSFTVEGPYALAAYGNGANWRGYAGLTDITIAGDTGTTGSTTITNRIRAELGASASILAGARSQTVTYTLSPGAPS